MSKTVRMRYTGPGGRRLLELPIPFIARSEKVGEVFFNPEGDLPEEFVEPLLAVAGDVFEVVTQQEPSPSKKGAFGRPLKAPSPATEGEEQSNG